MIKIINDDFLKVNTNGFPEINFIMCSPPFNLGIDYGDSCSDALSYEDYLIWSEKWIRKCFGLQPISGRIIINVPFTINPSHLKKTKNDDTNHYPLSADITKICQKIGYKFYRLIIWKKFGGNKTSWGSFKSASCPRMIDPNESLLVFYKTQWKRITKGTSTISRNDFMKFIKNLWDISSETRSKHPAAYPIELCNAAIKLFTYKEDTIMDCFCGSGTTGDSSIRNGRNFIGIEKSPEYFNMAKERIETAEVQTDLANLIMPDGDEE